jgi:hypothetical protein
MNRLLFAAMLLASPSAFASKPLLELRSYSASYAIGATAHLVARALVFPYNSSDDFFISATLNGAALPLNQVVNGPAIASVPLTQSGTYLLAAQLFLENARLAASLNDSIRSLNLQNEQLTTQLNQSTDPAQRTNLQSEITANGQQIAEATQELQQIRKPFGASQSISFTAQ